MEYSNYNLLLVDDNPVNVELLGEILTQKGFRISSALSGFTAIEKAREDSPDLIILDIAMPAIDGFEVFQILRNDPSTENIPVIFVTSLSDTEDIERAMGMGAADYITKPFSVENTIERICAHLKPRE